MKSENSKQMPHDRKGDAHLKGQTAKQHSQNNQDQSQGKFQGNDQKGSKIHEQTDPKGMGGTGGHPVKKEWARDTLDKDKQSYDKGAVSNDIKSTDTSSKAGFRRNDDKDADNRGATTSGIPGQGI